MSMLLGFSSNRDKTRRKSCHRRNDSGDLDVFDAEGYFSSINESIGHNNGATTLFHELGIAIRDDCTTNRQGWREGRVSLDIPATGYTGSHHYHHHHHHHHYHRQHSVSHQAQVMTSSSGAQEIKKHKQPSSPGGKLASFFNSLISQAISKKKKSSKLSSQPDGVTEEESPSSWRRRKSSNFSSSNTSTTTSTSTRTRTTNTQSPPYPLNTPTKSYKDLSRLSVSRCKNSTTQVSKDSTNLEWLDEKFKCIGGLPEKKGFDRQRGSSDKERSWVGRSSTSEESGSGFKRFTEDDGGESDSSSDLFELQLNYECSSGLPVYETTCMDSIKRSSATPITNVN